MVERWEISIPRLTGDKKRTAYCYLPTGYEREGERRYPVLYMFDGHNLFSDEEATFGKSWGLEAYLDYTDTQIIVAAVECNHEGDGRLEEYSPLNFAFRGKVFKGRGKIYMNWLTGVFKPFIDANFRTLPDRANTAIAGSSMGGLMTVYAVAKYGKFFSKGAALSPSLWVGGNDIPPFVQDANFRKDAVLYMDYGSREFVNHTDQRAAFAATTAYLIERGVNVTSRVVAGGTHTEASWERQTPHFMTALGFLPEK